MNKSDLECAKDVFMITEKEIGMVWMSDTMHALIGDWTIQNEMLVFTREVRQHVMPHYMKVDRAHGIGHVDQVAYRGAALAYALFPPHQRKHEMRKAIIAGYGHDMFQMKYRETHHQVAHDFFLEVPDAQFPMMHGMSDDDRKDIAEGCLCHRASNKELYYPSLFSEIVAVADRGAPKDISIMMLRSWQYAVDRLEHTHITAFEHAIDHIGAKYGKGGYVANPPLYYTLFEGGCEYLWERLESYRKPIHYREYRSMLAGHFALSPDHTETLWVLGMPLDEEDFIEGKCFYVKHKLSVSGLELDQELPVPMKLYTSHVFKEPLNTNHESGYVDMFN